MQEHITEDNFLVYCAKVYDNPTMHSSDEFIEDLNRLKYIKKLLTRYSESGELKERLILNHIITLHNCFGSHLSKIVFLKMERQFHMVKPFLIMINALPKKIYRVGKYEVVDTDDYPLDQNIVARLRGIL